MAVKLKEKYRIQVETDQELQGKIAKACGVSIQAPLRWAKENNDKLTLISAIRAIKEYNRISASDDITETIETVNA
jgi:hypothetical protein